jgi:hypothetical protein
VAVSKCFPWNLDLSCCALLQFDCRLTTQSFDSETNRQCVVQTDFLRGTSPPQAAHHVCPSNQSNTSELILQNRIKTKLDHMFQHFVKNVLLH